MRIEERHLAYLERTSRSLSRDSGKRVSQKDVLDMVLDLALADEGVYDPEDPGTPLSPYRRKLLQTEGARHLTQLDLPTLLARVSKVGG